MNVVDSENGKSFKIDFQTNQNNSYSVTFTFNNNNYFSIEAKKINYVLPKDFSCSYSFQDIRRNKYFLQFNNLKQVFDEIKEKFKSNKIIITENPNNLKINYHYLQLPVKK